MARIEKIDGVWYCNGEKLNIGSGDVPYVVPPSDVESKIKDKPKPPRMSKIERMLWETGDQI